MGLTVGKMKSRIMVAAIALLLIACGIGAAVLANHENSMVKRLAKDLLLPLDEIGATWRIDQGITENSTFTTDARPNSFAFASYANHTASNEINGRMQIAIRVFTTIGEAQDFFANEVYRPSGDTALAIGDEGFYDFYASNRTDPMSWDFGSGNLRYRNVVVFVNLDTNKTVESPSQFVAIIKKQVEWISTAPADPQWKANDVPTLLIRGSDIASKSPWLLDFMSEQYNRSSCSFAMISRNASVSIWASLSSFESATEARHFFGIQRNNSEGPVSNQSIGAESFNWTAKNAEYSNGATCLLEGTYVFRIGWFERADVGSGLTTIANDLARLQLDRLKSA